MVIQIIPATNMLIAFRWSLKSKHKIFSWQTCRPLRTHGTNYQAFRILIWVKHGLEGFILPARSPLRMALPTSASLVIKQNHQDREMFHMFLLWFAFLCCCWLLKVLFATWRIWKMLIAYPKLSCHLWELKIWAVKKA